MDQYSAQPVENLMLQEKIDDIVSFEAVCTNQFEIRMLPSGL